MRGVKPTQHTCAVPHTRSIIRQVLARMAIDVKTVVTPDLRVRGVNRLWVADASVFPRLVAGNINATTLMISEKAADLIAVAARS